MCLCLNNSNDQSGIEQDVLQRGAGINTKSYPVQVEVTEPDTSAWTQGLSFRVGPSGDASHIQNWYTRAARLSSVSVPSISKQSCTAPQGDVCSSHGLQNARGGGAGGHNS